MCFQITAIIILAVFYGCYFGKMLIQRKKGIRTDQIGKGKKGFIKLIEITMKIMSIAVAIAEIISIFLNTAGLPVTARYFGVAIAILGVVLFICSIHTMRDSWRAGVSETDKTELITVGVYQISRNPAFLGFDLVYTGLVLVFFNWILLVLSAFAVLMFHLQIVNVEEKFLMNAFGSKYLSYKNKVNRYIGRKGIMKKRAFLFIVLAGILWGTSVIFVNLLAPFGFSSLQMTFLRALVSFISFTLYAVFSNRELFKVRLKELILLAAVGISFFGTATCYYFAMQETSPATAVVLMYLAPMIVMVYSVIFLGEKLTVLKGAAVLAMLAGCGLVSGIIGGLAFKPLGIAVGVLSGISYAAYNIFTKIGTKNNIRPVSITLYCFFFAAVISFFVCSPEKLPGLIAGNGFYVVLLILAMAICTCLLPYFFYTLGMKDLPAGTASALGIVEPMAATVFSVVLFNEKLGIYPLVGIVLILSAIFVLSRESVN